MNVESHDILFMRFFFFFYMIWNKMINQSCHIVRLPYLDMECISSTSYKFVLTISDSSNEPIFLEEIT